MYSNLLFFLIFIVLLTIILSTLRSDKKTIFRIRPLWTPTNENHYCQDDFWSDIFKVSKHQEKIKPEILLQTIKFMIQEVNEEDPKLIEFVKTLIDPPSNQPRNLTDQNKKDFSQKGQSIYLDELFKGMKNGFIIEAGAFDGEMFSNSLFFEIERNWNGILIEPVPFLYESILNKNRKMYKINACIANKKPMIAKFKIASLPSYSGRDSEMDEKHQNRVGKEFDYIYVPCFSLKTILKAINVTKVDLFSLDLEGGEWDVLSSLDLKTIDFRSFVIEHNNYTDRIDKMTSYLNSNSYNLTRKGEIDLFFVKSDFKP
ncbi:unnamed protein product [Brachionus calyciflorus]|uniref:Methyltransferase FkbM domain-containing protein n=1 Tax=Brachionus calyciflorus TaxID=104777 RepID=A0A814C100_9BILA|nr:unnamed protein product [Brachionus calyciflorus]